MNAPTTNTQPQTVRLDCFGETMPVRLVIKSTGGLVVNGPMGIHALLGAVLTRDASGLSIEIDIAGDMVAPPGMAA